MVAPVNASNTPPSLVTAQSFEGVLARDLPIIEQNYKNLKEFYNLVYQYENDCLVAAIKYNKDYYTDRDLKPDESIFLNLTIIPFGQTKSPNLRK